MAAISHSKTLSSRASTSRHSNLTPAVATADIFRIARAVPQRLPGADGDRPFVFNT